MKRVIERMIEEVMMDIVISMMSLFLCTHPEFSSFILKPRDNTTKR
jgi:hypothetical protein